MSTLLGKADAVVVATVTQSAVVNDELSVDLTVLRNIKGKEHSSVHLTYPSPSPLLARQSKILPGITGIWFLSQLDSSWTVLPVVSGDIQLKDFYIPVPIGEPADSASGSSASASEKLIRELKAAALDPATANIIQTALQVTDSGLGPSTIIAAFSELSLSPNMGAKVAGVSGLLRNSAPGAATALMAMNLSELPTPDLSKLANGLCWYRGLDITQLALIQSLAASSYPLKLRSCAVHALREIHTAQTLPTLEAMLHDRDQQIRYDAVIGIAQFAIKLPIAQTEDKHLMLSTFKPSSNVSEDIRKHFPIQSKFDADEQEYISYWKDWLRKQQIQQN